MDVRTASKAIVQPSLDNERRLAKMKVMGRPSESFNPPILRSGIQKETSFSFIGGGYGVCVFVQVDISSV